MIDLTPLDVRNKAGDFPRGLRGYEPAQVDTFLELVAERMEQLVKENLLLNERVERLQEQVSSQEGRERAVQEALVTAQELRQELGSQAQREAEFLVKEAEGQAAHIRAEAEEQARRILADAEQALRERRAALEELERKRLLFLRSFRSLLRRELDVVEVEESREAIEHTAVELDLGGADDEEPATDDEEVRSGPSLATDDVTELAVPADSDIEGIVPIGLDIRALETSGGTDEEVSGKADESHPADESGGSDRSPRGGPGDRDEAGADRLALAENEDEEEAPGEPEADLDLLDEEDILELKKAVSSGEEDDAEAWLSSILDDDGETDGE